MQSTPNQPPHPLWMPLSDTQQTAINGGSVSGRLALPRSFITVSTNLGSGG